MRFRYTAQQVGRPVYPLGGTSIRWRPLVCALAGLTAPQLAVDCLVDSAADDTILPVWVAHRLGIDLSNAPIGTARAVGGVPMTYRYAHLRLRLSDGVETCGWTAIVGFLDLPCRHGARRTFGQRLMCYWACTTPTSSLTPFSSAQDKVRMHG
jgi:hypothetical protein